MAKLQYLVVEERNVGVEGARRVWIGRALPAKLVLHRPQDRLFQRQRIEGRLQDQCGVEKRRVARVADRIGLVDGGNRYDAPVPRQQPDAGGQIALLVEAGAQGKIGGIQP